MEIKQNCPRLRVLVKVGKIVVGLRNLWQLVRRENTQFCFG